MNNYLQEFFDRTVGNWLSFRNYYYTKSQSVKSVRTEIKITQASENSLNINWLSSEGIEASEGNMTLVFDTSKFIINRDRGYFTTLPTQSVIKKLTSSQLITETCYNDQRFVEEIKYYDESPMFRRRFTKVYDKNKELSMIGNYLEVKQV